MIVVGHIEIELEPGSDQPAGLPDAPPPRRRRRGRALAAAGAIVAVTAVVALANGERGHDDPSPTSHPSSSNAAAPATTIAGGAVAPGVALAGTARVVTMLADGTLSEAVPADGRVHLLALPRASPTDAVVVGADWVVVRPADATAGTVLDGEGLATPAVGGLDQPAVAAFPGRTPDSLWLATGTGDVVLTLYGLDGVPLGAPRRMSDVHHLLGADGNGEVAVATSGGTYVTSPDGWQRLTTGRVLALGPTVAVVEECDEVLWCRDLVVDRRTGTRRVLLEPASRSNGDGALGAVSADGTVAVLSDGCGTRLDRLDLTTGALTGVAATDVATTARPVWSPDGNVLWFVDDGHRLSWWSPATGASDALVSSVRWFAVRPVVA